MKIDRSDLFSLSLRPWGLIAALGVVTCGATILGFMGPVWWFLDLFSHFRAQYLITLLVVGALLAPGKYRPLAALCLGLALVNLGLIVPLYFGGHDPAPVTSPALRGMLINVNTREGSVSQVLEAVEALDPDFLVLEEINARWVSELSPLSHTHPHTITEPRHDNFGIGLFSKLPILDSEVVALGPSGAPTILATLRVGEADLRVIATHPVPPISSTYAHWRDAQLKELAKRARDSQPVIIIGDLNSTPWNHPFQSLLKQSGLKDSAQGFGIQPSWPAGNPLLRIPIDHLLHSPDIHILDRKIGGDVSSDHFPLVVDFALGP